MKKKILSLLFTFTLGTILFAQAPPSPPGDPGSGNTPVGGGAAPVGSGIVLLLALGAGYGTKRIYDSRKINR